ncbi:MAG: hypothetical protein PHI98_16365 [Eubacteriales bacterium]|nr:hypothetical protein [Eubacteriales bacterium]
MKTALITGSGRGIGAALTWAFAGAEYADAGQRKWVPFFVID